MRARIWSSRHRVTAVVAASVVAVGLLAACSGSGHSSSSASTAKAAETASGNAGLAAPGTTVPAVTVNYGIAPYEDDGLSAAGMLQGFYKSVGITIGPTTTGSHVTCTQSLAPLLTGQVRVCSGVYESLLSQTATVKNVTTFAYYSTFNYLGFFVKKSEGMKTLEDFLAQKEPFQKALADTLAQLKGKSIVLSNDPSERQFFSLVFELAGIKNPSSYFHIQYLGDETILSLAQAGKIPYPSPSGGQDFVDLENDGFAPLVKQIDVVDYGPTSYAAQILTHGTLFTTKAFYEQNYDTVLRLASVLYRLLNQVQTDLPGLAKVYLPFLNNYAGSNITESQLQFLYRNVAVLTTFPNAGKDFLTGSKTTSVYNSTPALETYLKQKGVISQSVPTAQVDGALKVWQDLNRYKTAASLLFTTLDKKGITSSTLTQAHTYYSDFDFLDAYRFAAAVAQQNGVALPSS